MPKSDTPLPITLSDLQGRRRREFKGTLLPKGNILTLMIIILCSPRLAWRYPEAKSHERLKAKRRATVALAEELLGEFGPNPAKFNADSAQ